MRFPALRHHVAHRFRRPTTWVAVAVFGGGWILARLMASMPLLGQGPLDLAIPLVLLVGHLILAPIPWQWTGDDRPAAPLLRGGLQALPWNGAWVFLVFLGFQALMPPPHPGPRPGPPIHHAAPPPQPFGPPPRPEGPPRGPDWMLLFLNLPFAMLLGWFLAEKEQAERVEAELRERERITRTQALQSQLNPHVLFNVLGGLTELVYEDPEAAERALIGLTELLRMLLDRATTLRLPLGQERALLKRYLEIESIRLGGRLKIHWEWPGELDSLWVPPLLLQPVVENAIRHGIAPCPAGGRLELEARRDGPELVLRVANTGEPLNPQRKHGTGLSNLEERLSLAPDLKGTFRLSQDGTWTVAELRLAARVDP